MKVLSGETVRTLVYPAGAVPALTQRWAEGVAPFVTLKLTDTVTVCEIRL